MTPIAFLLCVLNKMLRRIGFLLVPIPPSAKMLYEHANVSEHCHPAHSGLTVKWMREVADIMNGL